MVHGRRLCAHASLALFSQAAHAARRARSADQDAEALWHSCRSLWAGSGATFVHFGRGRHGHTGGNWGDRRRCNSCNVCMRFRAALRLTSVLVPPGRAHASRVPPRGTARGRPLGEDAPVRGAVWVRGPDHDDGRGDLLQVSVCRAARTAGTGRRGAPCVLCGRLGPPHHPQRDSGLAQGALTRQCAFASSPAADCACSLRRFAMSTAAISSASGAANIS